MRTKITAVVLLASAVTFGAACGDDDDGGGNSAERQETVDAIVESTGASEDEAECVVDGAVDAFGDDALDPDFEPSADQTEDFLAAFADCGVELGG
jgi:hypothetical protein